MASSASEQSIGRAGRWPPADLRSAAPHRALWISKYLAAGAGSLLLNLVLQAIFLRLLGLPLWLATVASYELALLGHFAANDRWVFARSRRGWHRLLAFHAAALPAEAITLSVTWALLYGPAGAIFASGPGPYLAKTLGTAVAAGWTFACCTFWIWQPRRPLADAPGLAGAVAPPGAEGT